MQPFKRGTAIEAMPAFGEALTDGTVSAAHIDVIVNAVGKLDPVFFKAHAATPPVAFLATSEVAIDHVRSQRQTGWNTLDDRQKIFAVGFSPVQIPKHDEVSGI